jgi:hypothetical protein
VRQADPETEAERGRDQPDQERVGQDDRDDLGARDAERSSHPERRATLDHGERHRVVGEKDADDQREERQRPEVHVEGPREAAHELASRGGRHHLHPRREDGAHAA